MFIFLTLKYQFIFLARIYTLIQTKVRKVTSTKEHEMHHKLLLPDTVQMSRVFGSLRGRAPCLHSALLVGDPVSEKVVACDSQYSYVHSDSPLTSLSAFEHWFLSLSALNKSNEYSWK